MIFIDNCENHTICIEISTMVCPSLLSTTARVVQHNGMSEEKLPEDDYLERRYDIWYQQKTPCLVKKQQDTKRYTILYNTKQYKIQ